MTEYKGVPVDITERLMAAGRLGGSESSLCNMCRLAADEIERLRAEINDQDSWYRAVMSETCQQDELHCACVPTLRTEIERRLGFRSYDEMIAWTPPEVSTRELFQNPRNALEDDDYDAD